MFWVVAALAIIGIFMPKILRQSSGAQRRRCPGRRFLLRDVARRVRPERRVAIAASRETSDATRRLAARVMADRSCRA